MLSKNNNKMKNNATVVALLLLVFCFLLIWPSAIYFSGLPVPSIFDSTYTLNGTDYNNPWITIVLLNNILFTIVVVTTMILLVAAFRKWNNIKYYDVSIIKKLDLAAYLFIIEGIIAMFLSLAVPREAFSNTAVFKTIHFDLLHGIFLLLIGLLFALITSVLTNAKVVKDENDLTI